MRSWLLRFILVCLTCILSPSIADTQENDDANALRTVPVLSISGAIGPAVGGYVIKEIEKSNQNPNIPAIIITLDTPGGLVTSLRDINQQILASNIPVLCLVHPSGARAASAGTYILYACHVAAMAPATTLGAATPVQIGGTSDDKNSNESKSNEPTAMEKKILNDSVAYIRSLAKLRGRNVEWAEKAVREAATLSADEALELNVIDVIAADTKNLINKANGRSVLLGEKQVTLDLSGVELIEIKPDWRDQFLATITNPNVAYILMLIGVYGLLLEFYSPGFGIAGIIGAISLLIAMYAFQLLPVNYVGLGLIIVGLALLLAESMIPSFGLLGFGGIVAFILGSLFLIDSELPELQVSLWIIYVIAAISSAFIIFVFRRLWTIRHKERVSGAESLIGVTGHVAKGNQHKGYVFVRGERWAARCDQRLYKDDLIQVERVEGLTLIVKKAEKDKSDDGNSDC
ncbi:nodulation protein NfeD [Vibrio hannami]|uniref:NfeD family protein n=1 Tax=Vibrio hannami TaxID=2717094 RepID=UPI00240F5259|nr:nodulation protein NfeD [Vibrio hannami]MDG3086283.1 nodulation protein NfeD [Vibrio hannami]